MTLWANRGSAIAGMAISNWPVRKSVGAESSDGAGVGFMQLNLGRAERLRKPQLGVA
jgi:hypothetical protein